MATRLMAMADRLHAMMTDGLYRMGRVKTVSILEGGSESPWQP